MRATLVLLAAGVLALGGCGDDDDDAQSGAGETQAVEESAPPTNEVEATEQFDLGEWGVQLTKDSDSPECAEAWQNAMG